MSELVHHAIGVQAFEYANGRMQFGTRLLCRPAANITAARKFPVCSQRLKIREKKKKVDCRHRTNSLALYFAPSLNSCFRLRIPSSKQSGRWS